MEHNPTQSVRLETSTGSSVGVEIIKVIGPLTMNNFFDFQAMTRKKPAPPVLIVDLSETPYIDSAALGSLVGLHVSCNAHGRKYALVNANERLHKLFEMTNVHGFLIHFDNVQAAEKALVA
jgi:anti-sigma B factor antagonist